jgi:tRNA modification GTPase
VDPQGRAYGEERARLPGEVPVTLVFNKRDLTDVPLPDGAEPRLGVCAHTGQGLEALHVHLKAVMGYQAEGAGTISARQRHVVALQRAATHVQEAQRQLQEHRAGELVAEELRLASQALGEITGQVTSEDLLGRIFSSFCIGK